MDTDQLTPNSTKPTSDGTTSTSNPQTVNTPLTTQVPTPLTLKKKKPWLLITLVVLLLGTTGTFAYKYYQLKQQVDDQSTLLPSSQLVVSSPSPESTSSDSGSFQQGSYQNNKFGFKLNYPQELNLTAQEYDIQADQREYIRRCDSGELEGCGGARWPDYEVRFYNQNDQHYFNVRIHVIPVAQFFGGKEYQNFTYRVQRVAYTRPEDKPQYYISESTKEQIEDSLSFFTPTQPLSCLWLPDFIAIDTSKPGINLSSYDYATGYYFNQDTSKCQLAELYYGSGPNIPFQSMEECQQACVTE